MQLIFWIPPLFNVTIYLVVYLTIFNHILYINSNLKFTKINIVMKELEIEMTPITHGIYFNAL